MQQSNLFPISFSDEAFKTNVVKNGYKLWEADIGDVTFQSGQSESIHRWYRLTPSFSPSVVRFFVLRFGINPDSLVFDPFAGRGTTIIECQKIGVPSIGFEINTLLAMVGKFSLCWELQNSDLFNECLKDLAKMIFANKRQTVEDVIEKMGTTLPDIHDVYRWWKPNVLRDLIIARQLSKDPKFEPLKHYLWLAVNSAALDCANIHRNHPTITFDDDHKRDINVLKTIEILIKNIQIDLMSLTHTQVGYSQLGAVWEKNACESFKNLRHRGKKITHVITSPPYPNRFSYIHQTRPQLHFMEVITDRKEATEIDLRTIGGTWGRATSNLQKTLLEPPKELKSILGFFEELHTKSLLMCNYATKYFTDLNIHVAQLRKAVSAGFRGAYIVGNSRLCGIEIFTEAILAKIFELHGFTVDEIVVFRKRGGRKRLYESAVCIKV